MWDGPERLTMHVAVIGGASTIGSTIAFALANDRRAADITLVDIDEPAATGHATDLAHGLYHLNRSPTGTEPVVRGIHPDDIDEIDPDVAVVAADKPREIDEDAGRDFRETTIDRIEDMLADIADQLDRIGPLPVVNATNPLDRVTYYLWRRLDWSRGTVFGYALSESARGADAVGRLRGVHPNRVWCPTLGEHGEHMVLAFSKATIDGEPVELSQEEKDEAYAFTQDIPLRIAEQRGFEESSRWVTSAGIARAVAAIQGEETGPFCLSVPVDGEYGFDTGCLALPSLLDAEGVAEIIEWELPPDERRRLKEAQAAIRSTLPAVDGR